MTPPTRAIAAGLSANSLGVRVLDVTSPDTARLTIDSYYGIEAFGATQHIYNIGGQRAVVQLVFNREPPEFRFEATVFLFTEDSTPKSIAEFINNLYSDGLYANPARPISTTEISRTHLDVLSAKPIGHTAIGPGEDYDDYSVAFRIGRFQAADLFVFEGATDTATIHVRTSNFPSRPAISQNPGGKADIQ